MNVEYKIDLISKTKISKKKTHGPKKSVSEHCASLGMKKIVAKWLNISTNKNWKLNFSSFQHIAHLSCIYVQF